jgi:hypothetical protein
MRIFDTLRSRLLLLSLSIFYDVAFVDRLWTDAKMRRATIGTIGVITVGVAGSVYALDRLLSIQPAYPAMDMMMLAGVALFVAGSWRGRISLAFNVAESKEVLRSRRTVICYLSDVKQASAYIEVIMDRSQMMIGENSLKATESYLVFASEIWFESMAKKGLNLIGEVLPYKNVGDLVARQAGMSSM